MAALADDYDFLSQLINFVQQNKLLYEKRDPLYFNRLKKEKAWEDIARQTNTTASECKTKWTHLREKFCRQAVWQWRLRGNWMGTILRDAVFKRFHEAQTEVCVSIDLIWKSILFRFCHRTRCNEILDDVTDSNSCSPVEFSGEHRGLDHAFTEDYNQSFATSIPTKFRKVTVGDFCDRFGSAIVRMEERFSTSMPVATDDSDELFMRTVLSMMKDLPLAAKDTLKEHIFVKVLEVRRENQE